jgi:hypothetical protein
MTISLLAAFVVAVTTPGLATASPVIGSPGAAPSGPNVLASGASLGPNQSIHSRNGQYELIQQSDGNLVLYQAPRTPIWSSQTAGKGERTVMQTDGNLVVRSKSNEPLFHTGTAPNPGAVLAVQDDGNLVVYSTSGKALWGRALSNVELASGRALAAREIVRSASDKYRVVMLPNGDLVLNDAAGKTVWATNTSGNPGARAVMQGDGNFVVVSAADKPLWHTGTAPNPGATLRVQDDGNVVVLSTANKPLWASRTGLVR